MQLQTRRCPPSGPARGRTQRLPPLCSAMARQTVAQEMQAPGLRRTEACFRREGRREEEGGDRLASVPLNRSRLEPKWLHVISLSLSLSLCLSLACFLYMYVHAHTHTHIHLHAHVHKHVHEHVTCTYTYIRLYDCTYIRKCTYTCIHINAPSHIHIRICIIPILTPIYTNIYYTDANACICRPM